MRARQRAYWKAVNLVAFDGARWVQDTGQAPDRLETGIFDRAWVQRIRVTLRALRTSQFVAAGSTLDILDSPARRRRASRPASTRPPSEPLRRGHAYRAVVYTPRPTTRADAPRRQRLPAGAARVRRPAPAAGRRAGRRPRARASRAAAAARSSFPGGARPARRLIVGAGGADATRGARGLAVRRASTRSPSACAPAPTRRSTYVRAIERHLADDGFSYSETPPPEPRAARRLPAARPRRLLPAVLRRDGAAAAHGRRARRASPAASRPAPATPSATSTSCATSTRTRGSSSTCRASAG